VTVAEITKLAWAATLRKYTRQNDIVFGQVMANRDIPVKDAETILGPLLSTVPCRVRFDDDVNVEQTLLQLQADRGAMMAHSHAGLVDIKRWSGAECELFDTLFVFQSLPEMNAVNVESIPKGPNSILSVDYTMEIIVGPALPSLNVEVLYKPSQISWRQAQFVLNEFDFTVSQVCKSLTLSRQSLSLWELSTKQKQLICSHSFGPEIDIPHEVLHAAFEERATYHPDIPAVESDGQCLSYGDLNAQASTLASNLADIGVSQGSRVAVIMDRCLEFPIGLLAALKVGAAMMPLDASFPPSRLAFIVHDAAAKVVVTTDNHRAVIDAMDTSTPILYIASSHLQKNPAQFKQLSQHVAARDSEAFIVYTSGSTGKPKGVPVLHGGAVNVIAHSATEAKITEGVRVMQFMAIGFDVCQWELWKTLSTGATLVFRSNDIESTLLTVNVLMCTPTGLSLLGHPSKYPNLNCVCVAGETVPTALKDLWCPYVCFMNGYGPSECSITTHFVELKLDAPVTLGFPLPNIHSYILDNQLRQVPVGVIGEICLGGVCVSTGYINLPSQTSERFVMDSFSSRYGKMFRTGDLGRMLPNGHFETLGRQDSQVKLKGYRIELDEVAEAIMLHPNIISAVAIVKDNSHLVGYFSPSDISIDELREIITEQLPVYMIPAAWVGLDVMPLNSNGKIDKIALANIQVHEVIQSLESDTEKQLAAVWSQVLDVDESEIGRQTSFFALGGDSITAIRFVAKAKQAGLSLTSANVMRHSTLERMARVTKLIRSETSADNAHVFGDVPLTPIQHINFNHPWHNVHYWNLSMTQKPRRILEQEELTKAIAQLVDYHDVLRTRFRNNPDSSWTQYILEATSDVLPNVEFVDIESFENLHDAIMEKERSLNILDGPLFNVTVFVEPDYSQYVQFTLHHTIVDLVSWRILLDDLQTLLHRKELAPKSLSFQEWSKQLRHQALHWDPSRWQDYMGEDLPPMCRSGEVIFQSQGVLDFETTSKLDKANQVYGTNIQELALAALTGALGQMRQNTSEMRSKNLHLMLEGHGREPWDPNLDVSGTIGWFTCEYPVVFNSESNISKLIRHVKEKLRALPDKGLSYGAIKYLAPHSKERHAIQSHQRHNISFNYLGRFQEMGSDKSLFDMFHGLDIPQKGENEAHYTPGNVGLSHVNNTLVLNVAVPNWLFTNDEVESWSKLWSEWMHKIIDHCLDSSTIGGRTLSDVPLLGNETIVEAVENELLSSMNLRPIDIEDIYPVTPLQSGILSSMIRDPSEYVLQLVFDIRGDCTFEKLKSCWNILAQEIPLLRTVFVSTTHGIYQAVTKVVWSEWNILNETWSTFDLGQTTKSFLDQDRQYGFTLQSKSFQRFTGVQVSDNRLRVIWTYHHSLIDGWSLPLVMDRFMALCYGDEEVFNIIPFKDHVEWLSVQEPDASRLFWQSALVNADKAQPLRLPKPPNAKLSCTSKYSTFTCSVSLPDIKKLCKTLGVTTSSVFRAAWAIILHQYTRSEHVIFGSVVSGRDTGLEGVDRVIGMLINTIPIIAHVSKLSSAADVITNMHSFSSEIGTHSHCSILNLKQWANIESEADLFDSILVYENYPPSHFNPNIPRPFTIDVQGGDEFMDTNLGVIIAPSNGEFMMAFTYKCQLIDSAMIEYLAERMMLVVSQISSTTNLQTCVGKFDVSSEPESIILQSSCFGKSLPAPFELLHESFEAGVKIYPQNKAVEFQNEWLSYRELNIRSNKLASELMSIGVGVGSRVAVIMQRCLEFPVALLAVLKTGGAIMALDASFPAKRLEFILENANAVAVVSTSDHHVKITCLGISIPVVLANINDMDVTYCDSPIASNRKASRYDEAFIVYTSGSSGKPKGVPVLHGAAVNVMMNTGGDACITPGTRVMQFMALGFDMCQWEIWATLSFGATVVFRNAESLENLSTVDVLMCTPTALSHLGHPSMYPNLQCVGVAGEAVPAHLKNTWCPYVKLINCYGPSECYITHFAELTVENQVDVGIPIANINCYVLDEKRCPVPLGVIGEVYLSGLCVSPGYIKLQEQTMEKFLSDPFIEGAERMYQTGDLGRLLPSGHFEILGRQDSQVKFKGYRIELDEVAEAIMKHPKIISAAVIVKDGSHLVGYFAPNFVSIEEIQETLALQLPAYMIPALWVGLSSLPLNSNGKIDKSTLAEMKIAFEIEEMKTDNENMMADIWARVLDIDVKEIGRQTSFFALGGDSLSVLKVVAFCKNVGINITASQLVKEMVLCRVALLVGKCSDVTWPCAEVSGAVLKTIVNDWSKTLKLDKFKVYPVTPLQAGMIYATVNRKHAYVMQIPIPIDFNDEDLSQAFKIIVQRNDILRSAFVTTPSGVYQIIRNDITGLEIGTVNVTGIDEYLESDLERGFSLGDMYFVRLNVVSTQNERYGVLTIHHALYDGWTISMIINDLMAILNKNEVVDRPSFRALIDYVEAQDDNESKRFWSSYLLNMKICPIASCTSKQSLLEDANEDSLSVTTKISMDSITTIAQQAGATASEISKLAWAATLRKYTRQNDVVFGQVMANRDVPVRDAERIMGPFINTIPCRIQFDDNSTLSSTISACQSCRGAMINFSHVGLTDINRWCEIEGDLFDTLFVYQNLPAMDLAALSPTPQSTVPSNFAFAVEYTFELMVEPGTAGSIIASARFDPSALTRREARLILEEYDYTLWQLCEGLKINALTSTTWQLSPRQNKLIHESSFSKDAQLPYELLHHAFENRVKSCPSVSAVQFETNSLSYLELNGAANAVATKLAAFKLGTGSRIAVIMERCLEFPVGLLAVLKFGGTIMALDAAFPPARLSYMLHDANATAIISTANHAQVICHLDVDLPIVYIRDDELTTNATATFTPTQQNISSRNDDAFIVYTSGSTGKPKGVPVSHRGAVNTISHGAIEANITEGIRVMQFMAIGFDGCQWEIWKPLSSGATVVLRGNDVHTTLSCVDVVMCTPTGLGLFGHPSKFPNLKCVFVVGEAVPSSLKDLWCDVVCLMNGYGPTECSIVTHFVQLTRGMVVTVGKPVLNTNCYVLDNLLRPVPVGATGEVYLGGMCVSTGYLNLPEESAKRFVCDPFTQTPMFRSGDLGRLLPNGHFEILGRQDNQVKLKGYRIELDEVAQAIMQHPRVNAATAIVKDKTLLVAYFTPADVCLEQLRETVSTFLPAYMVPAVWFGLDEMPLNTNGKIDKLLLAAMDVAVDIEIPATDIEKCMAILWSQVLDVNVNLIGRQTSFFALGGDSLSVLKVVAACKNAGIFISAGQLLKEASLYRVAASAGTVADVVWPSVSLSSEIVDSITDTWAGPLNLNNFVVYPVTPLQGGMIYATIQNKQAYMMQIPMRLPNDGDEYFKALQLIVHHHDILRTTFVTSMSGVYQLIRHDTADFSAAHVSAATIDEFLHHDRERGFEIGDKYFVRWCCVQTESGTFGVLTIHHALYDGWTISMLMHDFANTLHGKPLEARPSFRQVVDYIEAQDTCLTETYWRSYLSGAVSTCIGIPEVDATKTTTPLVITTKISMSELTNVAKKFGASVAEVTRLSWAATLRKYTRTNDVVFGHVLANRDIPLENADRIMGPLLSTVPSRIKFDDTMTVGSLLGLLRSERGSMISHSHASLSHMKRWSGVEGELFDTLFVHQNIPRESTTHNSPAVDLHMMGGTRHVKDYALEVNIEPSSAYLDLHGMYNPALMSYDQARLLLDEFNFTLGQVYDALCDDAVVSTLWKLSPMHTQLIETSSFGTQNVLPFELVHHAFEDRVSMHPEINALEFDGQYLTYQELNDRANTLAQELSSIGVSVGSRVAVIMDRCLEFPISLLAVLKVGAAMMPLDATFPSNRLSGILADANAAVVLTTTPFCTKIESVAENRPLVCVSSTALKDKPIPFQPSHNHVATRSNEAALLFTSGSTGKPKGVIVLHQGIVNVVTYKPQEFGLTKGARVLQYLAIGFDMCQWEIWGALSNGCTLVLRGDDAYDTLSTVDTLISTPTGLGLLGHPSKYPKLKFVNLAGEPLPSALKDTWSGSVHLNNCCGPSETTIISHHMKQHECVHVNVGKTIANMNCYVLDATMQPVPIGVIGEFYLSGVGVVPGYLNLPDETKAKFIPDPFAANGDVMYRSGDFGRLLPNGSFVIHGRQDSQVKLKGYRVELDEVAQAIMQHPSVSSAAAIVKDNSHLVGFFTPADINIERLRERVVAQLPAYMVPAVWIGLNAMPLNVNGKIDKKMLATLDPTIVSESLVTEAEMQMASVWARILGVEESTIGRQTSFFALGGDSMSVIKVVAACKAIGINVSAGLLLKEAILHRVAAVAETKQQMVWPSVSLPFDIVTPITQEWVQCLDLTEFVVYPVTPLQAGMIFATVNNRQTYMLQIPMLLSEELNKERMVAAFQTLLECHEILRTTFVTSAAGVFQIVREDIVDMPIFNVSAATIDEFLHLDGERGFEIGDKYFVRWTTVTTMAGQYGVLTIHHALYDGWTLSMLMHDFMDAVHGRIVSDRPTFRRVIDYINGQDKVATETYWRTYLSGATSSCIGMCLRNLCVGECTDTRPIVSTIPIESVNSCAQRGRITIADLTKFAWAATIRKFTRSNDVVFGQVMGNRDISVESVERILGPLLSTVPCRVQFDDVVPLDAALRSLQTERGAMIGHSHASLIDMKQWSVVEGDLFDTLFVFQNFPSMDIGEHDDATHTTLESSSVLYSSDYTFELILMPTETSLTLKALYNPTVLDWNQAQSLLDEFEFTLRLLCDLDIDQTMSAALWRLSLPQINLIQASTCGPEVSLPFELLHSALERRAVVHPHARAVEFDVDWLTYGDLNSRASTVAVDLAGRGICRGSRVAVIMDRCLEIPIALLAALKAGAAVIVLDGSFPTKRLAFMASNANVSAVITTLAQFDSLKRLEMPLIPILCIDARKLAEIPQSFTPATQHCAERTDEAYVVYTSGSTGKPKGVSILHQSAVNAISSAFEFQIKEGMRVMQFRAISSDVFHWEVWKTLSCGACLVFRGDDALKTLSTVDVVSCTPTGLSLFGNPRQYPKLKCVAVGGESLPSSVKDLWCDSVALINCYGPSECTIETHEFKLSGDTPVSIGKPMNNVSCYVLDHELRQVPVGVLGEIYLGGICVSPGYLNLPDQTAERFMEDPFKSGGRMYKSGDLGRLLPNGCFEVVGRNDSQVKLKGYRIELDEVADAMMQHPQLRAASVVVKGNSHLVGYYSPNTIDVDELIKIVSEHLPIYMIPAAWVGMAELPMSTSGKIDKKALVAMDVVIAVSTLETDAEKTMASIWADILHVDMREIGRDTSFFALGGDSISVIQVVSACRTIGLSLTVPQLVKRPQLWRAAECANVKSIQVYPAVVVPQPILDTIRSSGVELNAPEDVVYPVTPSQRFMLLDTMASREAYFAATTLAMPHDMDVARLVAAFRTVVQQNDILRASFVIMENDLSCYQIIRRNIDALQVSIVSVPDVHEFLVHDRIRGFPIGQHDAFFIRLTIVTDGTLQRHAVLSIHHALYDGWSLSMVTSDILDAYNGHPLHQRPSFRTVLDYVEATKPSRQSFWKEYLDGVECSRCVTWPASTDNERTAAPFPTVHSTVFTHELTAAANRAGVALSTLLQCAWAVTLQKYTHKNTVVFGQMLANRSIPIQDVQQIMGPVINIVAFRVHIDTNVAHMLQTYQSEYATVLNHAFADPADVQIWSGKSVKDRLFDTSFTYQNLPSTVGAFNTHAVFRQVQLPASSDYKCPYSFSIIVEPMGDGTFLNLLGDYDRSLLSPAQARLVLADYDSVLVQFLRALTADV
ncbi:hypothetical protein As57867_006385, partial [Aphanomyces stellatus]